MKVGDLVETLDSVVVEPKVGPMGSYLVDEMVVLMVDVKELEMGALQVANSVALLVVE